MSAAASAAERLNASANSSIRAIVSRSRWETIHQTSAQRRKLKENQSRICQAHPPAWGRRGGTVRSPSIREPLSRRGLGQSENAFRVQARPRNQDFRVADVAFDTSFESLGPGAQFRFGIASMLLLQSLSNVGHSLGVSRSTP